MCWVIRIHWLQLLWSRWYYPKWCFSLLSKFIIDMYSSVFYPCISFQRERWRLSRIFLSLHFLLFWGSWRCRGLARIVPAPLFFHLMMFNGLFDFYSITLPSSFSSCILDEVLHNTCIVLLKRPSELGLKVTFISFVLPDRTGLLSHWGAVQPQVVTISRMMRGCLPVFLMMKIISGWSS